MKPFSLVFAFFACSASMWCDLRESGVAGCAAAWGAEWRTPSAHPRLLIDPKDIAALRVRCGVAGAQAPAGQAADFGAYHEDAQRLREAAARIMQNAAGRDDLFAPAMLHLVFGQTGRSDAYTAYVGAELVDPRRERIGLDGLVALDWCWDALEPSKRGQILDRLGDQIEPLDERVSPLDPLTFGRRLEGLAAAIVIHPAECGERSGLLSRIEVIRIEAKRYFESVFPRFCRERGAMPTSPANGVDEEAVIALACELWRSATGENLLEELKSSAGRMLEHYFYADTEHPALEHGFIHDDGTSIPPRPGIVYRGFAPAVPFVLARYAGDGVAAWYAMRSLPLAGPPEADRCFWVRLLYEPIDTPPAARKAMPLGRDLGGGWVAMRGDWMPGASVLLFDAGQPFWRSRQHFDAGQFQIYRKGRLAIDSGDDVAFQAALDQGGRTLIGGERGDWDEFAQATIAHNCVTVIDRRLQQRRHGRIWPAVGNQRLIERDYSPGEGEIALTPRRTGSLRGFETNSFYTYAAADLTPAYPSEAVQSMSRQILFVHAGVVLVLDRLAVVKASSVSTWHLQLPARPVLVGAASVAKDGRGPAEDGAGVSPREEKSVKEVKRDSAAGGLLPLSELSPPQRGGAATPMGARQVHGIDEWAGIWELETGSVWLSVAHGDGRLFVRTLLPARAERRLIGGPMTARTIEAGPMAGRPYVGGGPVGYEYRLWPASFLRAPSASYELGSPVGLGPQFGVGAAWGRYEVSPAGSAAATTFLHVLIPTDAGVTAPPPVGFEVQGEAARVEVTLGDMAAVVELSLKDAAGQVSIRNALTGGILFEKELAAEGEE